MTKKKKQEQIPVVCPNCKCNECKEEHKGGSSTTFYQCSGCGKQFTEKSLLIQQDDLSSTARRSVGDPSASDQPETKNDPEIPQTRNKHKQRRIRPEERITTTNPRDGVGSEHVRGKSKNKIHLALKEMKIMGNENPFVKTKKTKEASYNLFLKKAREFKISPWGKKRKEDSQKNMIFNEGPQGKEDGDSKPGGYPSNRNFDTVDRKEYRSAPNPEHVMPEMKEWIEEQVDKYYDGWETDHIENSGGKLVGSNTEKTMNLNEGEREHSPKFPEESSYEKLLESRHIFQDGYETIVAGNKKFMVTTAMAKSIIQHAQLNDAEMANTLKLQEGVSNMLQSLQDGTATEHTKSIVLAALTTYLRENEGQFNAVLNDPESYNQPPREEFYSPTASSNNNILVTEAAKMAIEKNIYVSKAILEAALCKKKASVQGKPLFHSVPTQNTKAKK